MAVYSCVMLVVSLLAASLWVENAKAQPPPRVAPTPVPVAPTPVPVAPAPVAQEPAKPAQAPADAAVVPKVIRAVRIGPAFGNAAGVADGAPQTSQVPRSEAVAAEPVDETLVGSISLINGNTIAGEIRESTTPKVIRWQGIDFTEPFEVLTDAIKSIRFPAPEQRMVQAGEFAFELTSGDLISGQLVRWAPEGIEIDSSLFGNVTVRPEAIRRMYRIEKNPTLVFASLAGLQDWKAADGEAGGWQEDGAHLWTDQDEALINGNLGVPDLAMVEFEISWSEKPNFVFALAVDAESESDDRTDGWRFETFEDTLAVVREQDSDADVAKVQSLSDRQNVRLLAYLDQIEGRLQVFLPDGTPLATIATAADSIEGAGNDHQKPQPGRGVRLINRHGNVRLERLRIARWSGIIPTSTTTGDVSVSLADGTRVSGTSIRSDADSNELTIGSQETSTSLPLHDVVSIKVTASKGPAKQATSALFLHDGTRVSGEIESIAAGRWVVRNDQFREPVGVPGDLVRTVVVMRRDPIVPPPDKVGRSGRLELGQHKLTGRLLPAEEQESAPGQDGGVSCLRWQPFGCLNSSPLKKNANGRIVYRDPPPVVSAAAQRTSQQAIQMQQRRLQQQRRGLNFGELFLQRVDNEPAAKPVQPVGNKLHIRTGDVIPCRIDSIDERGVYITTAVADDTFVPHVKIKAVELVPNASPPSLKEAKKERLLTLPRLQKSSPPTHLLCSRNGDFLRCRLIELNDETIRVELQLEVIDIPRDRIAQIIWFHPEELLADPAAAKQDQPAEVATLFDDLAQVLKRDGKRVTFNPQRVDANMISGTSEVLGQCHFDLDEIDQLLFGKGIRDAVSVLPYNQWQLQSAVEPLMAQDLPGGSEIGAESPLIGQDAPEIRLDLLEGERFVLSECKGQIVVLDFWATWCAPACRRCRW